MFLLVAGVVWAFIAREQQFLPRFSRVLADFSIDRDPLAFIKGYWSATGRFEGREAALRLQVSRRGTVGALVVAMKTDGVPSLTGAAVDTQAQGDAARRALFTLAAEDVVLKVENGWLEALWRPAVMFSFPGPFAEEKWRKVLASLHVVASALEASRASRLPT